MSIFEEVYNFELRELSIFVSIFGSLFEAAAPPRRRSVPSPAKTSGGTWRG